MKSAIILTSLCVTLALANPVKRKLVTEVVYETVTVTVTGGVAATPAPAASPDGKFYGVADTPAAAVPVATTTSDVVAVPSPEAVVPVTPVTPDVPSVNVPTPDLSGGLSDAYGKVLLTQHNIHRANHSAPLLSWSSELASWAEQIGNTCVYKHSRDAGDGEYGQNIGAGSPPEEAGKMITNSMYNGEVNFYDWYGSEPDMSNFGDWGHFSQIVWAETTEVGCATVDCGSHLANTGSGVSGFFTVCNYRPAGNFKGRYAENVKASLGSATVSL